ncbi:MFS transporter [Aeribacillus pallidus]|uniref:MFS transporter n=1 Tax=Aeribacillus pallidus TaxID=33936 RepID=UPI003D1FCE03
MEKSGNNFHDSATGYYGIWKLPFIPVLSNIQQSLHLSYEETGLILSVFSIPAALIIPFLGFLSDRFTRKQVILSSFSSSDDWIDYFV